MQKIPVDRMFLIGMLWTSSTLAAPGITIGAIEAPAWMQQGDEKTVLATGDEIQAGSRLLTGGSGKIALQLELGASLQLDLDSEIELVAAGNADTALAGSLAAIKVHRGRACAQFQAQPDTNAQFDLLLGSLVAIIIQEQGHICVKLHEDMSAVVSSENMSSVVLQQGSVQITNLIEPTMVVLSETGSEYRFDDGGYFELGKVEGAASIEIEKQATVKPGAVSADETTAATRQAADTAGSEKSSGNSDGVSQTVASDAAGGYVYTVYLFSTRSREVADEVNQKLRDAGHQTLVISSADGEVTRYRIAVSDFSSRQASRDFAANIIGKFGIADTWIGRQEVVQ